MTKANDLAVDPRWNAPCSMYPSVQERQSGFTLVELMVVVAIIGALSAVAILSFRRYVVHARVGEGYTMLAEVRIREEQYRAEFGQYAAAPFHPAALVADDSQPWGAAPPEWRQIGARPDGPTRFQFEVRADQPGTDPGVPWDPSPPNDFWYVARGQADLDGDGVSSQFETYSASRAVWVNPGDGTFEYEGQ